MTLAAVGYPKQLVGQLKLYRPQGVTDDLAVRLQSQGMQNIGGSDGDMRITTGPGGFHVFLSTKYPDPLFRYCHVNFYLLNYYV